LGALVLLNVIHQDLQAAVYAAVIEIEAEPADLQRLAAAFVLPGVDARVELLHHLVVPREERAVENFRIAEIERGLHGGGRDHDGLMLPGNAGKDHIEGARFVVSHGDVAPRGVEAGRLASKAVSPGGDGLDAPESGVIRPGRGNFGFTRREAQHRPRHRPSLRVQDAAMQFARSRPGGGGGDGCQENENAGAMHHTNSVARLEES
jgi:hypothetical protein